MLHLIVFSSSHLLTLFLHSYYILLHRPLQHIYCYLALPIQIAYHTGMRAGEVCGLTWDDIDFENQVLYVRRSMYYDKDLKTWELKVPKNGKPRAIDF